MERAVAGPAIVALVIVLLAPAIEPQNLVHNGDFEATDEASPPPGWAMWGAQVYLGLPPYQSGFSRRVGQVASQHACWFACEPTGTFFAGREALQAPVLRPQQPRGASRTGREMQAGDGCTPLAVKTRGVERSRQHRAGVTWAPGIAAGCG